VIPCMRHLHAFQHLRKGKNKKLRETKVGRCTN
jgi:hypothetical protein